MRQLLLGSLLFCMALAPAMAQSEDEAEVLLRGSVRGTVRSTPNWDSLADSAAAAWPWAKLEVSKTGGTAEFTLGLGWNQQTMPSTITDAAAYLERMVQEASLRVFFDGWSLEAGWLKLVWGKGDNVHAVDILNPFDYSDFINQSYMERKIAQMMVRTRVEMGDLANLELVWEPTFKGDIFPTTGSWKQYRFTRLESGLTQTLTSVIVPALVTYYATTYSLTPQAATPFAQQQAAVIAANPLSVQDTATLSDGTYAARLSLTAGPADLGLLYAYTYYREPSVDATRFSTSPYKVYVTYDRVHMAGLEAAAAVGTLNMRAEGALFLGEDLEGSNPRRQNSRAVFMAGFDIDLVPSIINFNAQIKGSYVLQSDQISLATDTEYRANGTYYDHILTARLGASFDAERIKPALIMTAGLELFNFMLTPELVWTLADDLALTLRYTWFYGNSDTLFGQFQSKSFASAALEMQF